MVFVIYLELRERYNMSEKVEKAEREASAARKEAAKADAKVADTKVEDAKQIAKEAHEKVDKEA